MQIAVRFSFYGNNAASECVPIILNSGALGSVGVNHEENTAPFDGNHDTEPNGEQPLS
jgi:hypothetical protein